MARPATSPSARLKSLHVAETKAAKLKRGQVLTSEPMAELLGLSWVTLRAWCNDLPGFEASGCFERGGNGIEWNFRAAKTVGWLKRYFQRLVDQGAARAKRVRKIVGGDALTSAPDEYSLDELAKMIRLSAELQSAKMASGNLIDAGRVVSAFNEYHSTLQQAVLRAAQEQDPTGQWPPEIRESFEDAVRTILFRMEQAGQACLRRLRGGTA